MVCSLSNETEFVTSYRMVTIANNTYGGILSPSDTSRNYLALSLCSSRITHETGTCLNAATDFQNKAKYRAMIRQTLLRKTKKLATLRLSTS